MDGLTGTVEGIMEPHGSNHIRKCRNYSVADHFHTVYAGWELFERDDFLSRLPQDVLIHIASFSSQKDISKYVWKYSFDFTAVPRV